MSFVLHSTLFCRHICVTMPALLNVLWYELTGTVRNTSRHFESIDINHWISYQELNDCFPLAFVSCHSPFCSCALKSTNYNNVQIDLMKIVRMELERIHLSQNKMEHISKWFQVILKMYSYNKQRSRLSGVKEVCGTCGSEQQSCLTERYPCGPTQVKSRLPLPVWLSQSYSTFHRFLFVSQCFVVLSTA